MSWVGEDTAHNKALHKLRFAHQRKTRRAERQGALKGEEKVEGSREMQLVNLEEFLKCPLFIFTGIKLGSRMPA